VRLSKILFVLIGCLLATIASGPANAGPFDNLPGTWRGSGEIRLRGGAVERVRCNAYYTSKDNGDGLGIALRCASSSYKIELRSQLSNKGGAISGSWVERTFNASGSVTGRSSGNSLRLSVSGGGLNGSMSVSLSGSRQTVAINTQGIDLQSVNISLSRSG